MVEVFRSSWDQAGGVDFNGQRPHFRREILSLNGQPAVQQIVRITNHLASRFPDREFDTDFYLQSYHRELRAEVARRKERLREGAVDAFRVAGAYEFLTLIRRNGVSSALVSGTLEDDVREEAGLLDVSQFFGPHIHGSSPLPTSFSKIDVMRNLVSKFSTLGNELLIFGDGPVEIAAGKELGGISIGIASDESSSGSGHIDSDKAHLLSAAGADEVVADFRGMEDVLVRLGLRLR